jgi:hypothetical protein
MFPFMFIFMCIWALAGLGEVGLAPFVLALLFELPPGVQAADMNAKMINVESTIFRRMSFLLYLNELKCGYGSDYHPNRHEKVHLVRIQLLRAELLKKRRDADHDDVASKETKSRH